MHFASAESHETSKGMHSLVPQTSIDDTLCALSVVIDAIIGYLQSCCMHDGYASNSDSRER